MNGGKKSVKKSKKLIKKSKKKSNKKSKKHFRKKYKISNSKKSKSKSKKTKVGTLCNEPSNVLKPKLYCKVKKTLKNELKRTGKRWGAYTSGRLVKTYKRQGGTYSGSKKKDSNLGRWYKEQWSDICYYPKKKSCGRKKFSTKKFPMCRPWKKISSKTPKTVHELTPKQIKKLCAKKRKNPTQVMKKT